MSDIESEQEEFPASRSSPILDIINCTLPRTQNLLDALMSNIGSDFANNFEHDGESTENITEPNEDKTMPPAGFLNWTVLNNLIAQANSLPGSSRWACYSLPNNQLITMLDDVTDSISKGKDIPGTQAGEQIDYLITKVIIPTLQKVLFDDFSLQADHGKAIMSCIYRALNVFVAKLKVGQLSYNMGDSLWQMFRMIMNPNAKLYVRSSAHDIHLATTVAPGDLRIPSSFIRRGQESYEWFTTVIIWFYQIGGFTEFTKWAEKIPKNINFDEYYQFVEWMLLISNSLTLDLNDKALKTFVAPLLEKVMQLTDKDIDKTPVDLRESNLPRALFITKVFLGNSGVKNTDPERYELCHKLHSLLMKVFLRAIGHGNFFGKIMAMDEFIRIFSTTDMTEMNEEDLEEFIKEEHVVETLYKDNLHHLAYVERLLRIMNILLERKLIDYKVLDIIWDHQLGKHDAIQRNVNAILSKIAVNFLDEFFTNLFLKIEKSWNEGDDKVKEVVLDLMRRLGIELSINGMRDRVAIVRKIIAICWRWSTASEFGCWREKLFTVIFDVLHDTVSPRKDFTILEEQIITVAESCLDPMNCAAEDDPVARCLHFLRKLICLMPEEKALEDKNRNLLIRRLDEKFSPDDSEESTVFAFGIQVAQHICVWITQVAAKFRDSPVNSMEVESTPSSEGADQEDAYFANLRKRLDFFHFIIAEARRCYKEDFPIFQSSWIVALWNTMIIDTSHSLQSIGFRFFRDVVTTLLDFIERDEQAFEHHLRFFKECMLTVNPIGLSHNGFKCFSTLLKFVNISKGILKFSASLDLDDEEQEMILYDSDFEGEDYLWNVIMHAQEDVMQKAASNLLEKMYTSYIKHKANKEDNNQIIATKCVNWINTVNDMRRTTPRDGSFRLIKNTLLAILEVVEKSETDEKLVIRDHPTLRKAILVRGFKTNISFRSDDMHILFPPELLPAHHSAPITLSLNSNMLLYELADQTAKILTNQGGQVCTYPIVFVKKLATNQHRFGSKLNHLEWGSTMREVGIDQNVIVMVRMERSKIAVNPDTDQKFKDFVDPERCRMREKKFLSYQLAEHPHFIDTLLQMADYGELLEYCFQLLGSLPIKRQAVLNTKEDFKQFLTVLHEEKFLPKKLYYTFCLYERLLPACVKDPSALKTFFEADGVTSLLRLFSTVTLDSQLTIDFEIFFCDIMLRLVPNLVFIFLHERELADKVDPVMKKTFMDLKQNLDPYAENLGRQFRLGSECPDIDYDLDNLLAIVKAGMKFKSNGTGNIFYSAIIECRQPEDEEAVLDDDVDLGEDQCEHMVFNCTNILALLAIYKPEVGRQLLESPQFCRFLVVCVSQERACSYSYTMLITNLYHCVEKQLGTQHLIENLYNYMYEKRQEKTTPAYWEVLCSLADLFSLHHNRYLGKIEEYKSEMIEWFNAAIKETEETMSHFEDQSLLTGRLRLAYHLFEKLTNEEKAELGLSEGQNLIEKLIYNYLIPSSREFLQLKHKENGIGMVRSQTIAPKEAELDYSLSVPRSASCMLPSRTISVCKTEESQIAAYNLLNILADSPQCLQVVISTINKLFYADRQGFIQWDYQPDNNLRSPGNYVGLKNGGATCYMNSILQQLYMIPEIRGPILNVLLSDDLSDEPYQVKILAAIQSVFANLAGSELEAYTPDEFWTIFKLNERIVNVHEQQDAYEFYNKVVDLIDEGMEKLGAPKVGTTVFGGLFADEKICKDCPHRYSREEPFTSISIDVRSHNNMIDSLTEFVRGDVLENDNAYHCEKCDKKVRAVKRLTIKSLPDTLVIQLKRFEFDWERNEPLKFNDYFEFPFNVDMRPYTTEAMNAKDNSDSESTSPGVDVADFENYIYHLKGVVVHSGQATGGHYFSYIKADGSNQWYKFDDTEVTQYSCEPQDVKLKWFGEEPNSGEFGRRRPRVWWNAFILFYEKDTRAVPLNRLLLPTFSLAPDVPLCHPLTVEANLPIIEGSRRSSTASPVTRLHKRLSNLSLKTRAIPARLEVKVRNMNTKIMHEKNEFSYVFFDFIRNLVARHKVKYIENEEMFTLLLEMMSKFMFYTLIRASNVARRDPTGVAFDKESMIHQLFEFFEVKQARLWFINNVILDEELSRNFLLGLLTVTTNDKFIYARILYRVVAKSFDEKDYIDDLLLYNTPHLTNVLNKRRSKSKRVVDLLVESLAVLLREEHNEELDMIFTQAYSLCKVALLPHYVRCGYLSAATKYMDLYHYWDVMGVLSVLQLIMACFRLVDFRPNMKRSIISSGFQFQCNPYLIVDEENVIHLDDCLDGGELMPFLWGTNMDRVARFLDVVIHQICKHDGTTDLIDGVKYLCWNNFNVMRKTVMLILKYLFSPHSDFHYRNLYTLFHGLMNSKDNIHEERRILKFLLEHQMPVDHFTPGSPGHGMAQLPFIKNEMIKKRLLTMLVIALEAFGRHEDEDWPGAALTETIREIDDEFFKYHARMCEVDKHVLEEAEKALKNINYLKKATPIPTEKDLKIRLMVKCREFEDDDGIMDDIDEMESDNENSDQDVEMDGAEQPLDLTLGMARSSVNTPMIAEKRTLLQEDSDTPNEPAEPKKSRYSDNGEIDDEFLINSTSTSAVEFQEKNPTNPPPPYEDDNCA